MFPTRIQIAKERLPKRFIDKINFNGPLILRSRCWVWTGFLSSQGYPNIQLPKKQVRAHRLIYILIIGKIPLKKHLHHKCEFKLCVRPSHMKVLTPDEHNKYHKLQEYCVNGHPFNGDNLHISSKRRSCRACARENTRRYRQRKRNGI